ncbi:MAG: hypothetical protein ABW133_08880, partial [Polyangiaceae bacterium]
MKRIAVALACGSATALLALRANAQGVERRSDVPSDRTPAVDVRTLLPWATIEEAMRLPVGAAEVRPRLVMPGEFGALSYAPPVLGGGLPLVTAAETALSSRVSMMFEGTRDAFDPRPTGAAAGLRFHLLPKESPLQLSVVGGVAQPLIGTPVLGAYEGSTGLFTQINASYDIGRLRFTGLIRATASDGVNLASIGGAAGVSYDLRPVRVGLEYFSAGDKGGPRSALSAWVGVPLANERI